MIDSSADLRFPTPAADARVTTWVQSITTKNISNSGHISFDKGTLGGSAYEFIDTDEESQGDNATASVASTDFDRSDDITSLVSTECSGENGAQENIEASRHSALLDRTVEEAFKSPTIGCGSYDFLDNINQSIPPSIEFEEPTNEVGNGLIGVKYTVTELDEDQIVNALSRMPLQNKPKKLFVTIRQTMTKQSLDTKGPLRIIYVGSDSGKHDIIHKIASSLTASIEPGVKNQQLHNSGSQLYNIVPVSAFGSKKAPEIELMHSSRYQIKVDTCHFAQNLESKDNPKSHQPIKLFLDDNFSCRSFYSGKGCFTIEPGWELPHIAIFNSSNSDDMNSRLTRTIARNFMKRHNIPSIFISHKFSLDCSSSLILDQHSIHICLESENYTGKDSFIHQRLPIDLVSFLSIDARQMNRNLACLTGLHETLDSDTTAKSTMSGDHVFKRNVSSSMNASLVIKNRIISILEFTFSLRVCLVGILIVLWAISIGQKNISVPSISVNNKMIPAISPLPTMASSITLSPTTLASSSISSLLKSSAQGVFTNLNLSHITGKYSGLSMRDTSILQTCPDEKLKSKSLAYSAEIYGGEEIMIRISGTKKFPWPENEAISVNITRDNITIDTDKAFKSKDGIAFLLSKKEAYGIINVSIINTKKPRINETFLYDFGPSTSQLLHDLKDRIYTYIPRGSEIKTNYYNQLRNKASNMVDNIYSDSQATFHRIGGLCNKATNQLVSTMDKFKRPAKVFSTEAIKQSAIISNLASSQISEAKRIVRQIRRPLGKRILLAQVKSKVIWLQMQRMEEEARQYQKRAIVAIRDRAKREKHNYRWDFKKEDEDHI